MSVRKAIRKSGTVQYRGNRGISVSPFDLVILVDFDDAIIVLVSNQDITVRKKFGTIWIVELVKSRTAHPSLTILPNDLTRLIDQNNAIIRAPRRTSGLRSSWSSGASYQSESFHPLSIVHPDNCIRSINDRSRSKLPNDLVSESIDFNNPIIKLIGDQDIP